MYSSACSLIVCPALGGDIPYRHDQIANANRRVHSCNRTEVQIDVGLRSNCLAHGRYRCLHTRTWAYLDSVRVGCAAALRQCTYCFLFIGHLLLMAQRSSGSNWRCVHWIEYNIIPDPMDCTMGFLLGIKILVAFAQRCHLCIPLSNLDFAYT